MLELLKLWMTIFRSKFPKLSEFFHILNFISELYDMFGFISKFKKDVVAGFDAVHQRLVSLEAKVEALFNHTKTQAQAEVDTFKTVAEPVVTAAVATVEAEGTKVATVAEDAAKTVEAAVEPATTPPAA